jgi:quercetin dioxygenase-like cupin family protein
VFAPLSWRGLEWLAWGWKEAVSHEELLDLAEIYALGALDGDELAEFQAHLSAGCAECQRRVNEIREAFTSVPSTIEQLTPPDRVKSRIFEQIDADKPGYSFILAKDGAWKEIAQGISAKVLNMDPDRQRVTALVRMAPGSRYDNHRHTRTEELVVIEGSCYCGGKLLQKGDYHRAEAGSIHLDTYSDDGSLMLMITSVQNERLS